MVMVSPGLSAPLSFDMQADQPRLARLLGDEETAEVTVGAVASKLAVQIAKLKSKIQALKAEKGTLQRGRLGIENGGRAARLLTGVSVILGVASIAGQLLDEFTIHYNNKPLILSSMVFDLSLLAASAATAFIWYKYTHNVQRRKDLDIDIEAEMMFKRFINAVHKYYQDPCLGNRECVFQRYETLTDSEKVTLSRDFLERILNNASSAPSPHGSPPSAISHRLQIDSGQHSFKPAPEEVKAFDGGPHVHSDALRESARGTIPGDFQKRLETEVQRLSGCFRILDQEVDDLESQWFNLKRRKIAAFTTSAMGTLCWIAMWIGVIWTYKTNENSKARNLLMGAKLGLIAMAAVAAELWRNYCETIKNKCEFRETHQKQVEEGRKLDQLLSAVRQVRKEETNPDVAAKQIRTCTLALQELGRKERDKLPPASTLISALIIQLDPSNPLQQCFLDLCKSRTFPQRFPAPRVRLADSAGLLPGFELDSRQEEDSDTRARTPLRFAALEHQPSLPSGEQGTSDWDTQALGLLSEPLERLTSSPLRDSDASAWQRFEQTLGMRVPSISYAGQVINRSP